jgi:aldose 1-epimerase
MAHPLIALRAGENVCTVSAQHGAIMSWRCAGHEVLASSSTEDDPKSFACFVMAPFANRIAHGAFSFDGRPIALPTMQDVNRFDEPHALHGQAWRGEWRTETHSATSAVLVFDGGGDSWPWLYRVRQYIALTPHGLQIELEFENRANETAPASIGLHPSFRADAATPLCLQASTSLHMNGPTLTVSEGPIGPAHDFATPRPVAGSGLDHCYGGWAGVARLGALEIAATGCDYLHLYAPRQREQVALEPQTAPPNAPHHPGGSRFQRLAPGQRLTIGMKLKIRHA